jgi:YHS domain-containing protein
VPCPAVLVQDPERLLKGLNLSFDSIVDPKRTAVLERKTRAILGHDLFFFADEVETKRFLAEPFRWCGKLTDPVSGVRFVPGAASPKSVFEGRTYYFASAATKKNFDAMPAKYKNPVRSM